MATTEKKTKSKKPASVVAPIPQRGSAADQALPGVTNFKSVGAMIEEALGLLKLCRKHSVALTGFDWGADKTSAFKASVRKTQKADSSFVASSTTSRGATAQFHQIMGEAVVLRDQVVTALRVLELKRPEVLADVRMRLDGTQTPGRLLSWFTAVAEVVAQHQSELKVQGTSDPVQAVATQIERLNEALGERRDRLVSRGELASSLSEARGELAVHMVTLRRIAISAFVGNANVLKEFNRRIVKVQRKAEANTPSDPTPASPVAPTAAAKEPVKPATAS